MSKSQSYSIVQIVSMNNEGDSAYRMRWPAEHLAQQNPGWRVINLDAQAAERFEWALNADLLVLYQQSDPDMLQLMRERRQRGYKTLVEYNDNFYAPPAGSPAARAWRSPLLWHAYESIMQAADAVIVTGPGLSELLSGTVQNVTIIPNYLPAAPPEFRPKGSTHGLPIRLGWAGSIGHIADILSIKRVLQSVLRDYPNLIFCLMGNTSLPGELALPQDRVEFTPWGDMDAYYTFLDKIDIGLAPLLDTPYNRCRSDVKALEIAARSACPLLPDRLPYKEFLQATSTQPYQNLTELELILRKLLDDADLRFNISRRCHTYVNTHRVGSNNFLRAELYARYLPEKAGEYSWPLAAGYHEVSGLRQTQSQFQLLLQELESAYRAGSFSTIVNKWDMISERYPNQPELGLLYLRALAKTDKQQAIQKSRDFAQRYSQDIRFLLSAAVLCNKLDLKQAYWMQILEVLSSAPLHYPEHFREMLLKNLQVFNNKYPNPELAEKFLQFYPDAAELRYSLWRMHEAAGNDVAAKAHCDWLLQMHQIQTHAAQHVKSLNPEYLQAWSEGLAGRLEE